VKLWLSVKPSRFNETDCSTVGSCALAPTPAAICRADHPDIVAIAVRVAGPKGVKIGVWYCSNLLLVRAEIVTGTWKRRLRSLAPVTVISSRFSLCQCPSRSWPAAGALICAPGWERLQKQSDADRGWQSRLFDMGHPDLSC